MLQCQIPISYRPEGNENCRAVMAIGEKPAASSAKYVRQDHLIILFLDRTELIEVASPRAIGKIVRAGWSLEDGPASVVVGLSTNVIFVVDRAKLHPCASRD